MKLYHFPASPNSRRVLAVAFHLGIKLDLQELDLLKGEHLQPFFLKLNPNHQVPTLVDGDFVLWESAAIMIYLTTRKPGNTLYAADPQTQADINRWLFWNVSAWGAACTILIMERLIKKAINLGDPDPDEIAKGETQFHRYAQVLDDHLRGRDWLVGRNVTLADYAVASYLELTDAAQYPVEKYREINRWYGNIGKLEAWQKSSPVNFMVK